MMTCVMAFYDHYDGISIGFSGSKSRDRTSIVAKLSFRQCRVGVIFHDQFGT